MDPLKANGRAALESYRRRPILTRLWESYAGDLRDILTLYQEGAVSHEQVRESLAELVPALKSLQADGELARALHRADVVIVDRVLDDLHRPGETEDASCSK